MAARVGMTRYRDSPDEPARCTPVEDPQRFASKSSAILRLIPTFKMSYAYVTFALLLCLTKSTQCSPARAEDELSNNIFGDDQLHSDVGQYVENSRKRFDINERHEDKLNQAAFVQAIKEVRFFLNIMSRFHFYFHYGTISISIELSFYSCCNRDINFII